MDTLKKETFLESVYGWCYMMAGKFFRRYGPVSGIEFDEFFNIAYIAAFHAYKKFQPRKGELKNYILKCMKFELSKAISDNYRYHSQTDSIEELRINGIELTDFSTIDYDLYCMEVFECDVNTQELERLFDDRKLTIINDHYFNGKSLRDISVALDLSPSRVSQLHTEKL